MTNCNCCSKRIFAQEVFQRCFVDREENSKERARGMGGETATKKIRLSSLSSALLFWSNRTQASGNSGQERHGERARYGYSAPENFRFKFIMSCHFYCLLAFQEKIAMIELQSKCELSRSNKLE